MGKVNMFVQYQAHKKKKSAGLHRGNQFKMKVGKSFISIIYTQRAMYTLDIKECLW